MKRNKFLALGAGLALVAGALVLPATLAGASVTVDPVGGGMFQLDGNAQTSVPVGALGDDWDRVCYSSPGGGAGVCPSGSPGVTAPPNVAVDWVAEPNRNSSIFTGGGSKDPQDVAQWAWKDGSGGLPDKDNLQHGFAARYSEAPTASCPANGAPTCEVLYFGSDRFDNSGDALQGTWFFQNAIGLSGTVGNGGSAFVGVHSPGDVLVISDFSIGGSVSSITVYKWDPTCTGADKKQLPGNCGDANLRILGTNATAKCSLQGPGSPFCAQVNSGPADPSPWPFTDKTGISTSHPANTFLQGEFFEGGINLSSFGLGGECFSSVESETRSSTSTTATLKDFVLGGFGHCGSSVVTVPSVAAGADGTRSVSIGSGTVPNVTDSATVSVTGRSTWAGNVQFSLCGPIDPLADAQNCGVAGSGTPVGGARPVDQSTPTVVSSPAVTVTSVGKYCWRANFTHTTSGVPDATDPGDTTVQSECFNVTPVTPTLTTQAGGTVTIGSPVADTGTLANAASQPASPPFNTGGTAGAPAGGTISFTLLKANCTDPATGSGTNPQSVGVTGNGPYGPVSFTPDTAGTYHWVATYTPAIGDVNNIGSTHNGSCNDPSEDVIVNPAQPAITTEATSAPPSGSVVGTALDDTAHLSGTAKQPNGNAAGGTITFTLYGPFADPSTITNASCVTSIATRVVTVSGDGDYKASAGTVPPGTGSLSPTSPGTYLWVASYSGNLPNTLSVSGACDDPNEASLLVTLPTSIKTTQSFVPNDSAEVTVGPGDGNLQGSIEFQLFVNTAGVCNGTPAYDSGPIDIQTGTGTSGTGTDRTASSSNTTSYGTDGTGFNWLVTYTNTSSAQRSVTSTCTNESSGISVNNGTTITSS